jgi:formyltetrahydrofolate deformylase
MSERAYILTLSCIDRPGIVAAMSGELFKLGCNIAESSQYWDRGSNRFFMRIAFTAPPAMPQHALHRAVQSVNEHFDIETNLVEASRRPRIIIMVSKFDHALLHLLYQIRVGWLNAEAACIISNHEDSRRTADHEGIQYHVLPVTKDNKAEQEAKLAGIVDKSGAELIILARYMQVLSNDLSEKMRGRIINIHHSFLPSFKGAKPYHQAHERGVKLIGATAHYVTADLDEGPIIEQETERVSHSMTAEDFVAAGRDIESRVLSRAVKLHLEQRVLLNGNKTVVFG